jgi:hypothetical protein
MPLGALRAGCKKLNMKHGDISGRAKQGHLLYAFVMGHMTHT